MRDPFPPHPAAALALAAAGGLVLTAAFAPLFVLPGLAGLSVLFVIARAGLPWRRRLWPGFVFGFAHHLSSLYWVAEAFSRGPERFRLLGWPAALALSAGLALGPAMLAALGHLLRRLPFGPAAALFAAAWVGLELVREHLLRFPWNPLAAALAFDAWPLQAVAVFGTYGASLILAFLALLPAGVVLGPARARPVRAGLLACGILALAAPGFLRLPGTTEPADGPPLRIVQPAIAQHHKWDPERLRDWLALHLALTREPAAVPPLLVLWPESAVPFAVEDARTREVLVRDLPADAVLGFGADRFVDGEPPLLTNSFYLLAADGRILGRYDKVDLVPFGEYLPLSGLLSRLGLGKLSIGAVDFSPGPGRVTLEAPGLPPTSPLVCYEAAFPGRATDGTGRPRLLVNVTNDAWFGTSSGPYQHFALARMRAAETGLPLLRAANTGISAVIDGYGRVRAELGLGVRGVLDARIPPPAPAPPAATVPFLSLIASIAVVVLCAAVDLFPSGRQEPRRA